MQKERTPEPVPTQTNIVHVKKESSRGFFIPIVVGVAAFMLGLAMGQGKLQLTGQNFGRTTNTNLPGGINYSSVNELYNALRENYDGTIKEADVLNGLKHGLAASPKDPYTEYFSGEEAKEFQNNLQGTISGIGAKLELDKDGNVSVVAPITGSPAEAAGIRAKDIIGSVDGKSTAGMSTQQAVLKIRGKKGTKVTLGIVRGTESFEVTITRDEITVPSVEHKVLDDGVGYLQVNQFSDDTGRLVREAASDFTGQGVKKVILDLRDNPGGEVDAAVELASLWLPNGKEVLQQRRGKEVIQKSFADGGSVLADMPTVVLINNGSASASEIVALALKDHHNATLIGEKSYGKGVVQQLVNLKDGGQLKVTIAKWYSPNGTNINGKGITPDQEVKLSDEQIKNKDDAQLKAAQDFLAK
ncbi:S41 family peptidase [Candidatus Saccharibacteria bacterium]|nr:S41 family peptidase [Candidatus Saccharibacteria bacterium]